MRAFQAKSGKTGGQSALSSPVLLQRSPQLKESDSGANTSLDSHFDHDFSRVPAHAGDPTTDCPPRRGSEDRRGIDWDWYYPGNFEQRALEFKAIVSEEKIDCGNKRRRYRTFEVGDVTYVQVRELDTQISFSFWVKKSTSEDKPAEDKNAAQELKDHGQETVPGERPEKKDAPKKKKREAKPVVSGTHNIYMSYLNQTWLPGFNKKGEPRRQGDMAWDLEDSLIGFVKQVKEGSKLPKEIVIRIRILNNTSPNIPVPGFLIAAENLGANMKKFLEARLPKSIKISETHGVVEPVDAKKVPPGITVTPLY